jgi:hypothetical protein
MLVPPDTYADAIISRADFGDGSGGVKALTP